MSPAIQMSWEVTELYIFNHVKQVCFIVDAGKKKKKKQRLFIYNQWKCRMSSSVHPIDIEVWN